MPSLQEVAKTLAEAHRHADPKTRIIKFIPSDLDEIWLLEVSEAAPTTGEILPFRFSPDPKTEIYYPSVVILLSPDEWNKVTEKELLLPPNWDLSKATDL